jgi:serine/threonine protein kinase
MKKPAVFGKYLLLERLNVGGMAEVFIAKAFGVEGFERILAIKKILPTMAEDEEFIKMFIDEARISVQLNHANIVHIHELGNYEGTFFIAMEYVAGRDLRTILERYRKRKERIPPAQASFIASKMCEGLDYAHRKKDARGVDLNIIHRDVSPQNILCSYEGEVKIIDFGIAKAANRSQNTQAGILKGKFGYMSPEQVRGLPIDRRSDLFAVGVILYEMLTGEKLFVGESDFSTLEKVRNAEVPPPRGLNPAIPEGLERVVMKALAREAEDRYQWASELQEDLMRFLVQGDVIYASKHLSNFMKEAFAEDLLREEEKMERFAAVERPDQIQPSGLISKGSIKRPSSREIQIPPSRAGSKAPRDGSLGNGRGPTARVGASGPQSSRGEISEDVPIVTEEDVEDLDAPGEDNTRTEVSRLPAIEDEGSEPKTSIDPEFAAAAMQGLADGSSAGLPTSPGMDHGEEPRTATNTNPRRGVGPALGEDTRPRTVSSGKSPVVIGEPNGYGGETMVGPPPALQDARSGLGDDLFQDQTGRTSGPEPDEMESPSVQTDPSLNRSPPTVAEARPRKSPPKPKLRGPAQPERAAGRRRSRAPLVVFLLVLLGVGGGGGLFLYRSAPAEPSGVLLQVTPTENLTLTLGGQPVVNYKVAERPPGTYELVVSAPGYVTDRRTLTISEHKTDVLVIDLQVDSNASPPDPARAPGKEPVAEATPDPPSDPPEGSDPGPSPRSDPTLTAEPQPPAPVPPPAPPEPATFAASFTSDPPGAEVKLEGKTVGTTPRARASRLAMGKEYRYTARLAGYRPYESSFEGNGDPEVVVRFQMEREPAREVRRSPKPPPAAARAKGKLACSSNPAGAEVIVDGKPTGRQTPVPIAKPLELTVGTHRISFRLGGKTSKVHTVEIQEDKVEVLRGIPVE